MSLTVETGQENPLLRTPGTPVEEFNRDLRKLASAMHNTMKEAEGVGLAAPQIGKSLRLFVVDAEQMPQELRDVTEFEEGAIAIANPLLLNRQGEETTMVEGCLSLPDILVEVARPETITMQGQTITGDTVTTTTSGYTARILQHEMDHLDGILIIDKGKIVDADAPPAI